MRKLNIIWVIVGRRLEVGNSVAEAEMDTDRSVMLFSNVVHWFDRNDFVWTLFVKDRFDFYGRER